MIRTFKILMLTAAIAIASLLQNERNLFAIGNFSLGVNTGATYDPNNLERDIDLINVDIESYKQSNAGAKGEKLNVSYSLLAGCNLKYQFNYILFRIGGHFAKTYDGINGSVTTPLGVKNKIKISTYQASFPITVAFILPVKERTWFYMGGGMTFHNAYVKITQSNPTAVPSIGSGNMEDRYYGNFPGWHFLVGAEVPVYKNYSVSVEWIHQDGRSHPITNDGLDSTGAATTSPKRQINARGDFILFGVNYYISI